MLLVNPAIFILICHCTFKLSVSSAELNPIQKQSEPFNFIAVRSSNVEEIFDIQPEMPIAGDSLEENIINRIARDNLQKEKRDMYSQFLNKPQENHRVFQNRPSFLGTENQPERINQNFQQRNDEEYSSLHLRSKYPSFNEHFPSYSRKVAKGIDQNKFRLSLIKKLNDNKPSFVLKRSEELGGQNNTLDRLVRQQQVLKDNLHRGFKFPRRTKKMSQHSYPLWNNPLNLPRQPFSTDVMYHKKGSDYSRKPYQRKFNVKKMPYRSPKLFQKVKLNQTLPSSKLFKRISPSETQSTGTLKDSNIQFPDTRLLKQLGNFIEKLGNDNASTKREPKSMQVDNNRVIKEQKLDEVSPREKVKKTVEKQLNGRRLKSESTTRNQHLDNYLENKTDVSVSFKTNSSPIQQNEGNQTNIIELQKAKRANVFNTSQENNMIFDSLTTSSLFNGTTDEYIQIDLPGSFAAYSVVERERKALINRKKKRSPENWKNAVFILIGLAGFTGAVLIIACISYGYYKKKREARFVDIESSDDSKSADSNSKEGSRKFNGILNKIFGFQKNSNKEKLKRKRLQRKNEIEPREHHSEDTILNKTTTENVRTERKRLPYNAPMRYFPKERLQERNTPAEIEHPPLENENPSFYKGITHENVSEIMNQENTSDENICKNNNDMNRKGNVAYPFDKSDSPQAMVTEAFSKTMLRRFLSDSSIQNVYKNNSETESNEAANQSSSDSAGKLNNLPSLPSVSSSSHESDCQITESNYDNH